MISLSLDLDIATLQNWRRHPLNSKAKSFSCGGKAAIAHPGALVKIGRSRIKELPGAGILESVHVFFHEAAAIGLRSCSCATLSKASRLPLTRYLNPSPS